MTTETRNAITPINRSTEAEPTIAAVTSGSRLYCLRAAGAPALRIGCVYTVDMVRNEPRHKGVYLVEAPNILFDVTRFGFIDMARPVETETYANEMFLVWDGDWILRDDAFPGLPWVRLPAGSCRNKYYDGRTEYVNPTGQVIVAIPAM